MPAVSNDTANQLIILPFVQRNVNIHITGIQGQILSFSNDAADIASPHIENADICNRQL